MHPRAVILALSLGFAAGASEAAGDAVRDDRALFLAADQAIQQGEDVDLPVLMERLDGYSLAPYLVYRDLSMRLEQADAEEVLAFRERYGHLPVTGILERRWLTVAGEQGNWNGFRQVDRGLGGGILDCYRLQASRAASGVDDDWLRRARALWSVGRSQPEACNPVFEVLYEREALSETQRWARVEALMRAGNTGVARAIAERLTPSQREWLGHWLAVTANPTDTLARPAFDPTHDKGRAILKDGLQRLARQDQDQATAILATIRDNGWMSEEEAREMQRYIALRAAYDRDAGALALLDALPAAQRDAHVARWQALTALSAQDWRRLRAAILDLPQTQQDDLQWRYWRAVALARTGDRVSAARILHDLSQRRHYYGFLAADLLNRPYAMNHRPAQRDEEGIEALSRRPGLVRAREFFELGYHEAARREWHAALAGSAADTWRDAAHLALDWGWYGRTVHAANRAGLHDALELRFPLAFRDRLVSHSRKAGIDPALAMALIRKESAFDPGAVSRVGALGLMQLMPATARSVADDLGVPVPSNDALLAPEANLRLGQAYLDRMLERFDGSIAAAVAAYNAGPTRTQGWREENAGLNGTLWVENITYGETRDYVKSVMAFRVVFDWRLDGKSRRLTPALKIAGSSVLAARESR